MGVVEGVGMCWERMVGRERRGGRGGLDGQVLFDEGLLEEVVIEALPVDDDEGEDQEVWEGFQVVKKI